MAKKVIAAFLLLVIAAWAEMTMAPMFAMHAGHMPAGHEMAVDMPARVNAHNHAGQHSAEHHPATTDKRPCCPRLHKAQPEALLEIVSGAPACDDPHNCCFRQGPQSVPGLARDVQRLNRQAAPAVAVSGSPLLSAAERMVRDNAPALGPPPDVFGMTLRV